MKAAKSVLKILLRALALVLCLLLLAALALTLLPLTETVEKTAVPGAADWMAALPDELPLSRVVLPGTHDSATRYVQLAWFSKCQGLSIREQLDAGFRYLDVRLGDAEKGEDFPRLVHGFTNCRSGFAGGKLYLDAVLADCYAFLAAHPTETVVFAVKHEYGDLPTAEFERVLDGFVRVREPFWLLTDELPTLGEARGKLVLLRRYEDEAGLGARSGLPFLWADQKGSADTGLSAAVHDQGSYLLRVQDRFEYETEDKWSAFLAGMDDAREGELVLSFLSTKGSAAYGHPWKYAKALNAKLLALDEGALRGWIVVDFASSRLAAQIYGANFPA